MTESDSTKPDAHDAAQAAPDYHINLLENEQVRVFDTIIRPGETVPPHSHIWPSVMYVMSYSDFVRYDEHGNVLLDSRELTDKPKVGQAMWSPPLPLHSLENVGDNDLRVITVELKNG